MGGSAVNHSAAAYLVAYDISCPRRLGRVHRHLTRRAFWVQYSVFAGAFTPAAVETLAQELRVLIHPKQDDVRIYRLPENARPVLFGKSLWPEGALFGGLRPAPLAAVTDSLTPPRRRAPTAADPTPNPEPTGT